MIIIGQNRPAPGPITRWPCHFWTSAGMVYYQQEEEQSA